MSSGASAQRRRSPGAMATRNRLGVRTQRQVAIEKKRWDGGCRAKMHTNNTLCSVLFKPVFRQKHDPLHVTPNNEKYEISKVPNLLKIPKNDKKQNCDFTQK